MINGVLVERTVKEVVPALKTTSDGLKTVIEGLLKQYKQMQDEMDSWKVRELLTMCSFNLLHAEMLTPEHRKRTTCKWYSSESRRARKVTTVKCIKPKACYTRPQQQSCCQQHRTRAKSRTSGFKVKRSGLGSGTIPCFCLST